MNKSATGFKEKKNLSNKTLLKWVYKYTLGLVFKFLKFRIYNAYLSLMFFDIRGILFVLLEWGLYGFITYQMGKDAIEVAQAYFN